MSNPEENQEIKNLEAVAEIEDEAARDLSVYVPENTESRERRPLR